MSKKQTGPKIVVEKDENYKTIVVNGIFGGHRPGYFEALVYTDEMVGTEALASPTVQPKKTYIKRTIQCRLVFDPMQAKSIAMWLNKHIIAYEKTFGKVALPEEVGISKGKQYIT